MDTLLCPGCDTEFTPTMDRPAYPLKVFRKVGRSITAKREPVCAGCADRLLTSGTWSIPGGVQIMDVPPRDTSAHTSSCENCGTHIALPKDSRRKLIYCSDKCRWAIYRKRDAKGHTSSECRHCGSGFDARRGAKYCSAKCRQAAYRARA